MEGLIEYGTNLEESYSRVNETERVTCEETSFKVHNTNRRHMVEIQTSFATFF